MKSAGFTLIELIIILVIIGILAVSASPIFISDSGTKSQAVRLQAMSILRAVQQQAMQDTANTYEVMIDESIFGVSPYNENNNRQISGIEDIRFLLFHTDDEGITRNILVEQGVFSASIEMDALGRPTVFAVEEEKSKVGKCDRGCTITITENSGVSRSISINKEGFIGAQ
jgi:MSHA pilin protein MshC